MAKKKKATFKKSRKTKVGRGKPKGRPPAALQGARKVVGAIAGVKPKKKRTPRAAPPAPREVGLLDAIGEVMADVEDLGQEMRNWADGTPDSLQGGSKHSEVEEAADTLEEAANSDPVDEKTMSFLNEIKITIQDPTPRRRGYSRSARLGQSIDVLDQVIMALEEYENKDEPKQAIANELYSELGNIAGNLQGVNFPGQFG